MNKQTITVATILALLTLAICTTGLITDISGEVVDDLTYEVDETDGTATVKGLSSDSSATTVTIPDTISVDGKSYEVTSVADYAFSNHGEITSIKLGKNVSSIGAYAFEGTSITTMNLTPTKVTEVSEGAFKNCTKLNQMTLTLNKIVSIGDYAFSGCTNLTGVNCNKATTIGAGAFENCSSLVTFNGSSATKIGSTAFSGCSSLETLNTPAATSIGKDAFSGCNTLESVKVGGIDDLTLFEDATSLEYISPIFNSGF